MIEVNIDLTKLWAVSHLAAKTDVRYYLCGVGVEGTRHYTRLAATNGHILGMHAQALPPDFENKGCDFEEFIIPNEVIAQCKPVKSQPNIGTVLIKEVFDPEGREYVLRLWNGTLIPFVPVTGQFPNIRRVVPVGSAKLPKGANYAGGGAQFDPAYLALFVKVAKLLGDKDERIQMLFAGADKAIRIAIKDPGFIGVLMPQQASDQIDFEQPAWPDKGAEDAHP